MKKLLIVLICILFFTLNSFGGPTYTGSGGADGTGTDDQTAAEVVVTPAGDIAAIEVQTALEELDGEKMSTGTDTLTSAELLDTVSDETGTGAAVFGTAPTFTTSITIGTNVITEAEAGYLEDVTSSVQDQIDGKQSTLTNEAGLYSALSDVNNFGQTNAVEELSGNWEVQDDVHLSFGNDDDASIAWDAAAVGLEIRTVADAPIFRFDLANKTIWMAPTATPEVIFNDSDAPGADKYTASIGAQDDGTGGDGTEDADMFFYANSAGSKTTILDFDHSDGEWDFQSYDVVTSGELVGRNRWGADVATTPVSHNTTALHGLMYLVTVAATVNLDAAADAGYGACVNYRIRDAAEAVIIDLDGSEYMNLAGTALAQGVGVTATGAGEYLTLCATTDANGSGADGWLIYGETSGWASQ